MNYDHLKIESKWQKIWEKNNTFKVNLRSPKNPFYNLVMFPYPSAEGLHVGHIVPYSGSDTYGRFKKMQGFDVFEPMGFDAFGIHSENFALKKGIHPKTLISQTTRYFREKQMKRLGTLFDWSKTLSTTDPKYYQWTQWIFIKLFKANLAYKKKAPVTYCPSCKTVLADEQTEKQRDKTVCERCKTEIEQKTLSQWFFKITKYANRLLDNLEKINWPETTKTLQRKWIGKSQGLEIAYPVINTNKKITCFTTRPDTNFGATFIVIAPEHPLSASITNSKITIPSSKLKKVKQYLKKAAKKTEQERIAKTREKSGIFTGLYCLNRLNNTKLPIYISDFVIMTYGTGAVVGVPGHDKRDFEFAKKFNLPVKRVVVPPDNDKSEINNNKKVYEGYNGKAVNSSFLNGLKTKDAIKKISNYLIKKGWAKKKTTYRLRDWCISRQRYWGPPIPMINCPQCGWVPEKEENLPLLLPELKDYQPKKDGKPPLARIPQFVKTTCPKCKKKATRETDVSDTFLDSAWYFFRYLDPENNKLPFPTKGILTHFKNKKTPPFANYWLPVDMYIGGNEHACMHLLYTRFLTMVFHDLGFIDFEEPFKRFFAHGLITKDGAKMSKSKGNIVNPNKYLDKYGADVLRMYFLFLGPYSQGGDFQDTGIAGIYKFLSRIWHLCQSTANLEKKQPSKNQLRLQHKTIKKVTNNLQSLKFNTAIARIMEYYNSISKNPHLDLIKTLLLLLAPFAPHITEELWQKINNYQKFTNKNSIHHHPWPKYNQKLTREEKLTIPVQINGKFRDTIKINADQADDKTKVEKLALKSEKIKKHLKGKKPTKTIFVEGKLMNFVL